MEIIFHCENEIFLVKVVENSFALVNVTTHKASASVYVDTFLKWGYFDEYTKGPDHDQLLEQLTPQIEIALQHPTYLREKQVWIEFAANRFGNPHLRG